MYFDYTAFSAGTDSMLAPNVGTTLVFGIETLDIGGGYDQSTGIYTVQLNGTYTFTWKITGYANGIVGTALMINNTPKHYMWTESTASTTYPTTTATVVTDVNVGDKVYIKVSYKTGTPWINSDTGGYTTFVGWMLQ